MSNVYWIIKPLCGRFDRLTFAPVTAARNPRIPQVLGVLRSRWRPPQKLTLKVQLNSQCSFHIDIEILKIMSIGISPFACLSDRTQNSQFRIQNAIQNFFSLQKFLLMMETAKWEMVSGPGVEVGGTSRSEFGWKTTKVHWHMEIKRAFSGINTKLAKK